MQGFRAKCVSNRDIVSREIRYADSNDIEDLFDVQQEKQVAQDPSLNHIIGH